MERGREKTPKKGKTKMNTRLGEHPKNPLPAKENNAKKVGSQIKKRLGTKEKKPNFGVWAIQPVGGFPTHIRGVKCGCGQR